MKLEKALGSDYGRVFIRDIREGEARKNALNWKGPFNVNKQPNDLDRIENALNNYFGNNPQPCDTSHPLHPDNLKSSHYFKDNEV